MQRTQFFSQQKSIINLDTQKSITFQRIDEEYGKHIAKKLFEKYSNYNSQIDNKGSEEIIKEAYKILKKKYNSDEDDIKDFINCHNKDSKRNYLNYKDIENACFKYLVGPKGYGISFKKEKSEKSKLFDLLFKEIIHDHNSDSDMEKCRSLFEKYDTDKDGYLKKKDISNLLEDTYKEKDKKLDINQSNVDHYFTLLDKNQSKRVSYEEFEDYFLKAIEERNIDH